MSKNKEKELIAWLQDKKKNRMFVLMCYASISFKSQRKGMREFCMELAKRDKKLYHEIGICKYMTCGWADDLATLIGQSCPDFDEKFSRGISVRKIEEIVYSELLNYKEKK